MLYVKNNQIVDITEIRSLYPNTSIPDNANLEDFGYYKLIHTDPPAVLPWSRIDQGDPVDNTQTWVQVPMTKTEILDLCSSLLQERLDNFARERGYDNILAACSYATSSIEKFQTEGQKCVRLRDESWSCLFDIMNRVDSGNMSMPTWDQILIEMPALTW